MDSLRHVLLEAARSLAEGSSTTSANSSAGATTYAPAPAPSASGDGGAALADMDEPIAGPWGAAADVLLCLLPIAFLLVVTLVKPIALPTSLSLPMAAGVLWGVRLMYFASPPNFVNALVVAGLFEALTPLSIIFGAILLFQTMHHTKCLSWMMARIKSLSGGHPVAEVFLIAWAFAYLVEGASGFGTPVALASPMLSQLGHEPMPVVVCCLVMNTLATQFGAVGTPIWFGFGGLGLTDDELKKVGFQTAIIVGVTAFIVPVLAASFLVRFRDLLRNLVFILLSVSTAVIPSVLVSVFNYEFPSLAGGIATLFGTASLIYFKVGLRPVHHRHSEQAIAHHDDGDDGHGGDGAGGQGMQGNNLKLVDGVGLVSMPAQPGVDFPLTVAPDRSSQDAAVGCDLDGERLLPEGSSRRSHAASPYRVVVRQPSLAAGSSAAAGGLPPTPAVEKDVEMARAKETGGARGIVGGSSDGTDDERQFVDAGDASKGSAFIKDLLDKSGGGGGAAAADPKICLDDLLDRTAQPVDGGDMEVSPLEPDVAVKAKTGLLTAVGRTMPIWLTVLVLLVTRIPQLGIKGILQDTDPSACAQLGTFGQLCCSYSVVVQLKLILDEAAVKWKYELLYVPSILPFVVVSMFTILVYIRSFDKDVRFWAPFRDAASRVKAAVLPTLGALVLVQLIRQGGTSSPSYVIGYWLSVWLGGFFLIISAFLGALGSFFSGSTTVSNLTFGGVQQTAAELIGVAVPTMLAIQTAGATMGNMICINNVISARAVMGLNHIGEGAFILRTAPIGLLMGAMSEAIGYVLTLVF